MAEQVSTRPLMDKLGVRSGARVALIDVPDMAFRVIPRALRPR